MNNDRLSLESIMIDVSSFKPNGLGRKKYTSTPRIGEWVEMDVDGVGTMFEVVMVAHSSTGDVSDIYVRKLSVTPQAVLSLCNQSPSKVRS